MWIETLRCDDAPLERRRHDGLRPQSRIAADRERAFGLAQARQISAFRATPARTNDATARRLGHQSPADYAPVENWRGPSA
jgi:hypothetical protein